MKYRTRLGLWNIRTMSDAGTLRVVEREMKNYNLEILGLNETRWNGFGEMRTQDGNTLIYSGHEDENAPRYAGVADVRLKIAAIKTQQQRTNRPYDTEKIRNKEVANAYAIQLSNRFETLSLDGDNIDENWSKAKEVFQKTSEETLGYREKRRNPWISQKTWKMIQERKELKQRRENAQQPDEIRVATQEFNKKHREVKRSFRTDKRKWAEDLAAKAEFAEREGNTKDLYKITKLLTNKRVKQKPIRSKEGNIIAGENEQMKRWREYFEDLLNQPNTPPEDPSEDTFERESREVETADINIRDSPPSKSEIIKAIKELKNGKAPGIDNLPPEIFKQTPDITANILHPLFLQIWEKEKIPGDWKKGLLKRHLESPERIWSTRKAGKHH
ncbi:hypothetical protein M8J75_010736 [Diaphorina citri]|nr:hypothetical protein M8J75_010736 [Diaphorina citri]